MSFQVGEKVRWSSQAQGRTKTKTGVVVRVLPPGHMPTREEVCGSGFGRPHESYIIEADKPRTQKYYWPRVSQLARIVEGGGL